MINTKTLWGYTKGENYDLGCTGGSVCVYNKAGEEVAVFKGISKAYNAAFIPNQNRFIVRSTDGIIAVYSLDEMKQVTKFRFSKLGNQENGYCFSSDGSLFYLIENYNGLYTRIHVYETENFTEVDCLLGNEKNRYLTNLECFHGRLIVLGYMRNFGVISCGFVAYLDDGKMNSVTRIALTDFDYVNRYKTLELFGFTEKAMKWLPLPDDREKEMTEFSLVDLF